MDDDKLVNTISRIYAGVPAEGDYIDQNYYETRTRAALAIIRPAVIEERADAWHKTFLETQKHNEELRAENEKLRAAVNGKLFDKALKAFDENDRLTAERDAAAARAEKAEGLLLDAYNTWGEWPQETLARIADFLNKGGGK